MNVQKLKERLAEFILAYQIRTPHVSKPYSTLI